MVAEIAQVLKSHLLGEWISIRLSTVLLKLLRIIDFCSDTLVGFSKIMNENHPCYSCLISNTSNTQLDMVLPDILFPFQSYHATPLISQFL